MESALQIFEGRIASFTTIVLTVLAVIVAALAIPGFDKGAKEFSLSWLLYGFGSLAVALLSFFMGWLSLCQNRKMIESPIRHHAKISGSSWAIFLVVVLFIVFSAYAYVDQRRLSTKLAERISELDCKIGQLTVDVRVLKDCIRPERQQ